MVSGGEKRYELPNGWGKRLVQRKVGVSMGKWDVYLITPDGAKLRSNPDLVRYQAENPEMAIDTKYINFEKTFQLQEEGSASHKRLVQALEHAKHSSAKKSEVIEENAMAEPEAVCLFYPRKQPRLNRSTYSKVRRVGYMTGYPRGRRGRAWNMPAHLAASTKGKAGVTSFTKNQQKYLKRQRCKIGGHPTFDHCVYMALQLKVTPQDVKDWFREQLKLDEELERTREVRCFDVLLSDKEVEPLPFSEVEDFQIVTENIELVA